MITPEPEVTRWSAWSLAQVANRLTPPDPSDWWVIAVDGRSGSGKSTFATALASELGAALLHTDDFAWWHSAFHWCNLLIDHGLAPLKRGEAVDFRPPAWIQRGRSDSITAAPASTVIIEGVGAAQTAMRPALDRVVWVQADFIEAERRGIERDLRERPDPDEAKRFWDEWMAEELPFQEQHATWSVADLFVCGTPELAGHDRESGWLCALAPLD